MNKKYLSLIIAGIVVLVALILFGSSMFYKIQQGERAVIFKKFTRGLVKDKIYEPGFHIIAPWDQLTKYDAREQRSEETMDVLDKNGLTIVVDILPIITG